MNDNFAYYFWTHHDVRFQKMVSFVCVGYNHHSQIEAINGLLYKKVQHIIFAVCKFQLEMQFIHAIYDLQKKIIPFSESWDDAEFKNGVTFFHTLIFDQSIDKILNPNSPSKMCKNAEKIPFLLKILKWP